MIIETERGGEKRVVCAHARLIGQSESGKAYYLDIEGIGMLWFPVSECQVEKVDDAKNPGRVAIEMPRWLAVKKEIV